MNVIDMFDYESNSYRRQLKEFYRFLDQTKLPVDSKVEDRKQFLRRMFGRFIQISKLKRNMSIDQILTFFKVSDCSAEEIESGIKFLNDREFFLVITYLGCAQEIPIFLKKVENSIPHRPWPIENN